MQRYPVLKAEELSDGEHRIVEVKGIQFGIYRINGQYYAWRNVCPHAGAPVCRGKVCGTRLPSLVYEYKYGRENEILRCPWHGWEFDLLNGEHLVDPETRLRQGKLELGNPRLENLEPGVLESDQNFIYIML
jgi:nitrite reductase/ring-hydroxylating ferredoxin subunit